MTPDEARQLAMGYAWGREDASKTATAGTHEWQSTWSLFADAYAQGYEDSNTGRRCSMTNVRDAYEKWQDSGGRSIFARGDLTLPDDQREELRSLWPDWWSNGHDTTAYYARQAELQDAAWDAAGQPAAETSG
jgi:hypothetical protein